MQDSPILDIFDCKLKPVSEVIFQFFNYALFNPQKKLIRSSLPGYKSNMDQITRKSQPMISIVII